MKLRGWLEMVQARMTSGQATKDWCKENGISVKTYYYRLKCIRLSTLQEPEKASLYLGTATVKTPALAKLDFSLAQEDVASEGADSANGVFAVTVRIGDIAIDISNNADPAVIASTLRLVRDIC